MAKQTRFLVTYRIQGDSENATDDIVADDEACAIGMVHDGLEHDRGQAVHFEFVLVSRKPLIASSWEGMHPQVKLAYESGLQQQGDASS